MSLGRRSRPSAKPQARANPGWTPIWSGFKQVSQLNFRRLCFHTGFGVCQVYLVVAHRRFTFP